MRVKGPLKNAGSGLNTVENSNLVALPVLPVLPTFFEYQKVRLEAEQELQEAKTDHGYETRSHKMKRLAAVETAARTAAVAQVRFDKNKVNELYD